MGKVIDIKGRKFNRLTAIKHLEGKYWLFKCDCGKEKRIVSHRVRYGLTKSCGCYSREKSIEKIQAYNATVPKTQFEINGDIVTGTTGKGNKFIFDFADYDLVSSMNWNVDREGYVRTGGGSGSKRLHHVLMGSTDKVDHINGDPRDNRRCNIRFCSDAENARNRRVPNNNTSGVSGVTKHKNGGWTARIGYENKRIYLGYFKTFEEAKEAREKAREFYYGEFARN